MILSSRLFSIIVGARQFAWLAAGALLLLAALHGAARPAAADWPQQMGDAARTAVSAETLAFPLSAAWTYQPAQPPQPAWPQPGKELHRSDFDYAPQPVIAAGRVYFGSSGDDAVRALDLKSGRLLWRFVTGGPVRFAPAIADGKAVAVSDDGCAYCLDAATGAELWRVRVAPGDDLLLGNERMISRWPMRSGVAIESGVVYTAAGMWPSVGVSVVALDLKTGAVIWRNDSSDSLFVKQPHGTAGVPTGVSPQGLMAIAGDRIIVPCGRGVPAGFDKKTGALVFYEPQPPGFKSKYGGCWTTTHGGFYFNAGHGLNRLTANVGELEPQKADCLFAYRLADGARTFILPQLTNVAISGGKLFGVGGADVTAYDWSVAAKQPVFTIAPGAPWNNPTLGAKEPPSLWKAKHGRGYTLAVAGDSVVVGGRETVSAFDAASGAAQWQDKAPGQARGLAIADGCVVAGTDTGAVICYAPVPAAAPVFTTDAPALRSQPKAADSATQAVAAAAADALARSGKTEGYALVMGGDAIALAPALAAQSKLQVLVPMSGAAATAEAIAAARAALCDAGLNGSRVAIVEVARLDRLPFAPYFADLVVIAGDATGLSGAEAYRALRPCGGTMLAVGASATADKLIADSGALENERQTTKVVRGPLPGAGEWRHNRANAGQTNASDDQRLKAPLELLWFGGLGPDRLIDRHFHGNMPLSVNGRIFQTGDNDVIACDAYNGRILWITPLKDAGKFVMNRNNANMVADDTLLYVKVGAVCHVLDQITGKTIKTIGIPPQADPNPGDWGMFELADGKLLGSCFVVNPVAPEEGVSRKIFALSAADGSLLWTWTPRAGVLWSSFAVGEGKLFCVDAPVASVERLIPAARGAERDMVAVSLDTGKEVWRVKCPGSRAFVMYSRGVVADDASCAFDAATGKLLWNQKVNSQRPPAVAGDWIIAQPSAYNLLTGEQRAISDSLTGEARPWEFSRQHGCGGITGCASTIFFRSATVGYYDFQTGGVSNFGGVRAGCGLSIIVANGLALIPERASGCSCAYSFMTSLALAPAADFEHRAGAAQPAATARDSAWLVYEGKPLTKPLERLNLAFGAPADRRDAGGALWLAYPRPATPGALPVGVKFAPAKPAVYTHPRVDKLTGDTAWVCGTGVSNPGTISVSLAPGRQLGAIQAEQAIAIDGRIDSFLARSDKGHVRVAIGATDSTAPAAPTAETEAPGGAEGDEGADGDAAEPAAEAAGAAPEPAPQEIAPPETASGPSADVWLRHDDTNLYIVIQAPGPQDGRRQWTANAKGQDARVWEDDSWEAYLTDTTRAHTLHLGVSASGARYDALDSRAAWNGEWQSAATAEGGTMAVEMAIPLKTLRDAGLRDDNLALNVIGSGPRAMGSPDVGVGADNFSARWEGFITPPSAGEYTFTLRGDDVNNLWIDGKQLISFDQNGPAIEKTATVTLAAQAHAIKIEHAERNGTAEARLYWSGPALPRAIVAPQAFKTAEGAPGLAAAFWNGTRWGEAPPAAAPDAKGKTKGKSKTKGKASAAPATDSAPAATRVEPNIDFQWGPEGWNAQLQAVAGLAPGRCDRFANVVLGDASAPGAYLVRLRFAEMDGVEPGQRVFDVAIQDKPALTGFDIAREAGGADRPVVKEIRDVAAPDGVIEIDLTPDDRSLKAGMPPILSGLEIVRADVK